MVHQVDEVSCREEALEKNKVEFMDDSAVVDGIRSGIEQFDISNP